MTLPAETIALARDFLIEMQRRAGVKEWLDADARQQMVTASIEMALALTGYSIPPGECMPTQFLVTTGTPLTIKNSGGTAAITLASLANSNGTSTGARQAVTLDLGENWARRWRIDTDFELASTPTANAVISLFGSFSNATGAGKGNTSGTDAAYSGYSSNLLTAAKNHLQLIGIHACTVQATTTVQKAIAGEFTPLGRYLNLVVVNQSGAAFHSTDTNQVITLTPLPLTSA